MRILAVALPALFLAGCGYSESNAAESSAIATKQFDLSGFDQVSLRGSDDVEVEGGVLKIGRKNSSWTGGWSDSGRHAKVIVTMPAIRGAKVAGSGDMTVDRASGDAFSAAVAGSGNLKVGAVEAKTVELNVAGSGNLGISGQAQTVRLSAAGSGDITAKGLKAETANVSVAGSGNASAQATASASVSVVGSGNVEISGTDNCKISKVGSGEVTCKV